MDRDQVCNHKKIVYSNTQKNSIIKHTKKSQNYTHKKKCDYINILQLVDRVACIRKYKQCTDNKWHEVVTHGVIYIFFASTHFATSLFDAIKRLIHWVNPATISVKSVFDCIKEVQGDKCVCLGQVQSVNDNWVGDIDRMQCVRLTSEMCN